MTKIQDANELVKKIIKDQDGKGLIKALGNQEFSKVTQRGDLQDLKENDEIKEIMLNLNTKVNDLSPANNINREGIQGIFDNIKYFVMRTTPVKELQNKYANSSDVIKGLTEALISHQLTLKEDNISHETARREYIKTIEVLKEEKATLEEALTILQEEIAKETDEVKADRMRTQLAKPLTNKISEYSEIMLITSQGELASNILIEGNEGLIESINSIRVVTLKALEIGLRIAIGLENQKKAIELSNVARSATNSLISANAKALNAQQDLIAEQSQNTVTDINVLQEAIDLSIETLQKAKNNDLKVYEKGLENIQRMKELQDKYDRAKNEGDFDEPIDVKVQETKRIGV